MDSHHKFPLCTLCLDPESNLVDVFEFNERGFKLPVVIHEFLQLKVTKEGFIPWMICTECIGKLKDFVSFRNNATKSMSILKCLLFDKKHHRSNTGYSGSRIAVEEDDSHPGEPWENVSPGNLVVSVKVEPENIDSHGIESEIPFEEGDGHFHEPEENVSHGNLVASMKHEPDSLDSHGLESEIPFEEEDGHPDEPGQNFSPGNLVESVKVEPDSLDSHGVESEIAVEEDDGHPNEPWEKVSPGSLVESVKVEPDNIDSHGFESEGGDVFPEEGSSLPDGESEEFTLYLESDSEEDGAGAEDVWCDASGAKLIAVKEDCGHPDGPGENVSPGNPVELVKDEPDSLDSHGVESEIPFEEEDGHPDEPGQNFSPGNLVESVKDEPDSLDSHGVEFEGGDVFPEEGSSLCDGESEEFTVHLESDSNGGGAEEVWCVTSGAKLLEEEEAGDENVHSGPAEEGPLVESCRSAIVGVSGQSPIGSNSENDSHSSDGTYPRRSQRVRVGRSQLTVGCGCVGCHAPTRSGQWRSLSKDSATGDYIGPSSKPQECVALGPDQVNKVRVQAVKKRKKGDRLRLGGVAVLDTPRKMLRSESVSDSDRPRDKQRRISEGDEDKDLLAPGEIKESRVVQRHREGRTRKRKQTVALRNPSVVEDAEKKKEKFKEYSQKYYALLSEEERKALHKRKYARRKQLLELMSPEKRKEYVGRIRNARKEYQRKYIASLSEEERKALSKRINDRNKQRVESMTLEEREEYLIRRREYSRANRKKHFAALSEEERKVLYKKTAKRYKERLASMSVEDREQVISKRRIRDRARNRRQYAALSEEEKKTLNKSTYARQRQYVASMSAEEREEWLERRRYYKRRYSANRKRD